MALGHDLSRGKRTQDVKISDDISFDTLLLSDNTLKGLRKSGFIKPSPIQLRGIPLGKCGFDLLLEAKSGTGKTAVFTVIALEKLDLSQGVQTIMLAPTREIASQICDVINVIGVYYKGLNVAVVMGGLPVKEDIEKFKDKVHIVVGSPGRLRHLIQDKHIDISSVRLLVLDEADKLLEKSFLNDINYIFSLLPKQKQVIMSSATYPEEIKIFIGNYVKKAQHVCPDTNSILLGIEQKVSVIPYSCNIVKQTKNRYEVLKNILSSKEFKQCLIFCNYQARVAEIHRMLTRDKWPSEQLYGNQDQSDRLGALKTLQEYKCRIMVSTDLAARGIDASNVDLVINFEPPLEWQTYLHRIGRAGRYGSYGLAITFLSEGKEESKFKDTLVQSKMTFDLKYYETDGIFDVHSTEDSTENNSTESTSISDNLSKKVITIETNLNMNGEQENEITTNTPETNLQNNLILEENETKQEIFSFDELLNSFNASEQNGVKVNEQQFEYKHVNISKIPTSNLTNGNSHLLNGTDCKLVPEIKESTSTNEYDLGIGKTNNRPVSNHENKSKNILENEDDFIESYKIDSIKNEEYNGNEQALIVTDLPLAFGKAQHSKKYSRKSKITHNTYYTEKSSESYNLNSVKEEKEYDSCKQALIDAGLPLAFGKPKQSRKVSNKPKQSFENRIEFSGNKSQINVHNPCKQRVKSSNPIDNTYNIYYKQHSDEDNHSSSEDSDEVLPDIQKSRKPQCTDNGRNFHSDVFQNHSLRCESRQQRCKQFDEWYRQLRNQSKFIQYTFYLEELKRL